MHIPKFEILAAGLGLISPVVHAVTQASPQYNFIYGACGKITNFASVFPYVTSYEQGDVIGCQSDCSSYGSAFSATGNDNHNDHNDQQQLHKVYDYLFLDVFHADFDFNHHKCGTNHHPPTQSSSLPLQLQRVRCH
ncbi:hypothetical protein BDP67DRAFT_492139 [Colletotrichum lupini]|nr:hypothetical protein BDP67DRAFT_492139 [Colletotrichum lupini]